MKYPVFSACIIGIAALSPLAASPVAAGETRYSCDTPENRYSAIRESLDPGNFALSGEVSAKLLRRGRVVPTGSIVIADAGGQNSISIMFVADNPQVEAVSAYMNVMINGERTSGVAGTADVDTAVPFALVAQGTTSSITIGSETLTFPVDLSGPKNMAISCSTGEFLFDKLNRR